MSYLYFSHDRKTNKMREVHAHKGHELYYLAKGRTKYLIGDEIYSVEAGNVVVIPKGIYHMTDSDGYDDIERYLISFDDGLFDDDTALIFSKLAEQRLISIPINHIGELDQMLDSLEDLFSDNRDISIAMRKIQALSVLSFICRHKREYVSRVSESDRIIYEIIAFISSHYGEEITLESLSHKFSVSKSHLSRRFKEVSGIGLNDYIQHVRIMNAERLLLEGGSSITEIAESCGFNDSNYFSTVFKRQKGITPLRFAQSKKVDRN